METKKQRPAGRKSGRDYRRSQSSVRPQAASKKDLETPESYPSSPRPGGGRPPALRPRVSYTDLVSEIASLRLKHQGEKATSSQEKHNSTERKGEVEPWQLLQRESAFNDGLKMLKGIMFKLDFPYRTRLHFQSSANTSAAGVVNTLISVNTIGTVTEWGAVDVLFDEFFVHSMTLRWFALNNLGKGIGQSSTPSAINSGGISNTTITNAELCMCSLFNGAAPYTAAQSLANNATVAYHNSGDSFKYVWRNNTRFDKRGQVSINQPWQGWMSVNNYTNYGGQLQVRTVSDVVLGNTTAVVQMATIDMCYDVSFRARG